MNTLVKTFLINLVLFSVIALTMMIFGAAKEAYILLFKFWLWLSAVLVGYFVILQIQNSKNQIQKTNQNEKNCTRINSITDY